MYCLPIDDVCQMEQFRQKVVAEAAEDNLLNRQNFSLGTFNGCSFFYTRLPNAKPVIVIIELDKSDEYNAVYSNILGD
jgi:hypothetical protein